MPRSRARQSFTGGTERELNQRPSVYKSNSLTTRHSCVLMLTYFLSYFFLCFPLCTAISLYISYCTLWRNSFESEGCPSFHLPLLYFRSTLKKFSVCVHACVHFFWYLMMNVVVSMTEIAWRCRSCLARAHCVFEWLAFHTSRTVLNGAFFYRPSAIKRIPDPLSNNTNLIPFPTRLTWQAH